MADKVTIMVLKVDLQCDRCYKKVKKVLCKFPQIRDQMYDKKANTVTITVVCCSPEKIRDKIRCKGGESIESIEIKPPPKPPKPEPKPENKDKNPIDPEKKIEPEKCKTKEPSQEPAASSPPRPMPYPPIGFCCTECYHGHGGGPCHFNGPPPPLRPCYGRRVYYCCWGCGGYQYYYACEENPQACSFL